MYFTAIQAAALADDAHSLIEGHLKKIEIRARRGERIIVLHLSKEEIVLFQDRNFKVEQVAPYGPILITCIISW